MDIFYVITIAAIILGALGVWLFVWTLRSGQYDDMDGAAQRIEYDGKTDVVTFRGQAMLSRLVDGKLTDRSQGNVIAYNQITDVFTVAGGAQGATPTNPGGRVRVMLTPQTTPAAAASAPKSPPALKVTPKLGTQP